jgi:hypothetical protein
MLYFHVEHFSKSTYVPIFRKIICEHKNIKELNSDHIYFISIQHLSVMYVLAIFMLRSLHVPTLFGKHSILAKLLDFFEVLFIDCSRETITLQHL